MIEAAAEGDEELLHKYLEGGTLTDDGDQAAACSARSIKQRDRAVHVRHRLQEQGRAGAARRGHRIHALADRDAADVKGIDTRRRAGSRARPATTQPFSALAFKILNDPFVGNLTFFRVYSGTLNSGDTVYVPTKDKKERIGRLLQMHANERTEIKEVRAGDIAAAVGLKDVYHRRHAVRPEEGHHAREDGHSRCP